MAKLPSLPGQCPSCGNYNDLIAHFCANCGERLSDEKTPSDENLAEIFDVDLLDDVDEAATTQTAEADLPDSPTEGTNLWKLIDEDAGGQEQETGETRLVDPPIEPREEVVKQKSLPTTKTALPKPKDNIGFIDSEDEPIVPTMNNDLRAPPLVSDSDTPLNLVSEGPELPKAQPATPPTSYKDDVPQLADDEPLDATLDTRVADERNPSSPWLAILNTEGTYEPFTLGGGPKLIGKSEQCNLDLKDDLASRFHAIIALLGDRHFLIDVKSRRGTLLNGQSTAQAPLRSRGVIRIGQSFLVYLDGDLSAAVQMDFRPLNPQLMDKTESQIDLPPEVAGVPLMALTVDGKTQFSSSGEPNLIGSHHSCSWQMRGRGVADFHAQIIWTNRGPCLWHLGSEFGTFLNRVPVEEAPLEDGDDIKIGKQTFQVKMLGSFEQELAHTEHLLCSETRALCVTCVRGPDRGGTHRLEESAEEMLILGKQGKAHLPLVDETVRPIHSGVNYSAGKVIVRDLTGENLTVINGVPAEDGKLVPGQQFKIGHDIFLVHYDPSAKIYR